MTIGFLLNFRHDTHLFLRQIYDGRNSENIIYVVILIIRILVLSCRLFDNASDIILTDNDIG